MPLLKDLISIPERVHQGDFVLHLTKGLTEPDQTRPGCAVTPQLLGLLDGLQSSGSIERKRDQRIQMPDVYRIGFGFGRRGGVKPLK